MPELPEVETVVRQLAPLIVGRRVVKFEVFDPLLKIEEPERADGRKIEQIERVGKQILITLDGGPRRLPRLWMAVHLRMTGRLLWREEAGDSMAAPSKPSPLRARWRLDRGVMIFHDTRRFGTIRFLEDPAEANPTGQDPTARSFTAGQFAELLAGSKTAIKPWLLRQDRLVGVGNIYASEALFEAGIHPARSAGSLSGEEIEKLRHSLRAVLARSIKAGGTTFSDFQNARGDIGNYQHNLRVYDHAGEPCPQCGAPLERIVQAQRSTYFCKACQPAPKKKRGKKP